MDREKTLKEDLIYWMDSNPDTPTMEGFIEKLEALEGELHMLRVAVASHKLNAMGMYPVAKGSRR